MNSENPSTWRFPVHIFLLLISLYFDYYVRVITKCVAQTMLSKKKIHKWHGIPLCICWRENISTQRLAHIQSSIIHNGQKVGTIQVFINWWITKCGIFIQWNITHQWKGMRYWCMLQTWMSLENIMLSGRNQS